MPRPRSPLRTFFQELRRRNVWRALGIFVGGGWAVLQVVDLFIERGFVPAWVFNGAFAALALGLPIVLATAWVEGAGSEWAKDEGDAPDFLDRLTWKRTTVGGILAFAALGVGTSIYMVMRVAGVGAPATLTAQGVFDVGGRIVLADFESSAPETAPGDLITEALRIDLSQSPTFELVQPSIVRAMRELMLMPPEAPLDEESAREVAVRDGSGAVVSGEVGRLGPGFVLTARVLEAETGDALASFRVTATSDADLLEAIDDLASQLRGKIGESLRSVAASAPLPEHTTTSLEALKKVARVRSRLDRGAMTGTVATQLIIEAVALDSTFASAHQYLSIIINNLGGDRELGAASSAAAYRHRARLSEGERLQVEAHYFSRTVGDIGESNRVFRRLAELDPQSVAPGANLGNNLMYAGQYEEAVRELRRVPGWESGPWRFNLVTSLAGLGDLEAALAVIDSAQSAAPEDPYLGSVKGMVFSNFDLPDRARDAILLRGEPEGVPLGYYYQAQAQADFVQGRVESGRAHALETMNAYQQFGGPGDVIQWGVMLPWTSLLIERSRGRAASDIDALLVRVEWEELSSFNRNYPLVALTYALIGDTARVTSLASRFEAEVPAFGNPYAVARMAMARGLAAVESRGAAGIPELEAGGTALLCKRCADLFLGHGYEVAGQTGDAIAAYERFIESRFFTGPEVETHLFVPVAYERLGLLYAEQGDRARAIQNLERVAILWEDGDAEVRDRVNAELARVRDGG